MPRPAPCLRRALPPLHRGLSRLLADLYGWGQTSKRHGTSSFGASPACWQIYTGLIAGDPPIPPSPDSVLLVDAYAAQHPGGDSPQATQSVAVHLVALSGVLSRGHPAAQAMALRVAAVEAGRNRGGYPRLEPVPSRWSLTAADLARSPEPDRPGLASAYVLDVLDRWVAIHHHLIDRWYEQACAHLG